MIPLQKNTEQGQTLIETLVAAFILTMGIAAALGLATYSLRVSSNVHQQTVAIGLAKEGIEVVKMLRDTNWLNGNLSSACYNFESPSDNNAYCYQDWLNPPSNGQDIRPLSGNNTFVLKFDAARSQPWTIVRSSNAFGLDIPTGSDYTVPGKLYYHSDNDRAATNSNSGFARKITITDSNFEPFNHNTGTRLKVTSQVWWSERNCPMTNDVPASKACLVTLETYLTNWKNF
jgi:type II secretory pathway pseudopilin PulG